MINEISSDKKKRKKRSEKMLCDALIHLRVLHDTFHAPFDSTVFGDSEKAYYRLH